MRAGVVSKTAILGSTAASADVPAFAKYQRENEVMVEPELKGGWRRGDLLGNGRIASSLR